MDLAERLRGVVEPLRGARDDYDGLLDLIGDARLVMLGEASHGTHEFYRQRAVITRRLILEKGFCAVAVEADWPDSHRVHRYIQGESDDRDAEEALRGFRRFPTWMWRNADMLDFVGWLRDHNDGVRSETSKVGFYGLDLYSLYASMEAVVRFLDEVDPEAARRARERYSCFDHFWRSPQLYGYAASLGSNPACEDELVRQLAEHNVVVRDAERYYRSMFSDDTSAWNLRDELMADTLDAVVQHLDRTAGRARIVVWEHNSHLGDARATERARAGAINVGELMRLRHHEDAVAVGFTTHSGTVIAAHDWDAPASRRRVCPALPGSYEALFHEVGVPRFLLRSRGLLPAGLEGPMLERAIGVVYRPETERQSHYFLANLPQQFDAVLHFDETRAVEPLEGT